MSDKIAEFPHREIVSHIQERVINLRLSPEDELFGRVCGLQAAARYLHDEAIAIWNGMVGPDRVPTGIGSVISSAFQTYGGEMIHQNPFERAAVILRGITGGHPFCDGNKRAGFLLAEFCLLQDGLEPINRQDQADEMYNLCMHISQGHQMGEGRGQTEDRELQQITKELERIYSAP